MSSPSATAPGVQPTKSDVKAGKALEKAEDTAYGKRLDAMKNRWAGPENPKSEDLPGERKPGLLERISTALSGPVSAVAGAVEHFTGTGQKSGLAENVLDNVSKGGTFGDIIRKKGASNWVAAPLGLTLDIVLDPTNWATAGTSAIVPRVAKGLQKAGAKGTGKAVTSSLSGKGSEILRFFSKKYRDVQSVAPVDPSKDFGWMGRFARKTVAESDEYDRMVGGGLDAFIDQARKKTTAYEKAFAWAGKKMGPERTKDVRDAMKMMDEEYYRASAGLESEVSEQIAKGRKPGTGQSPAVAREMAKRRAQMSAIDDMSEEGLAAANGKYPNGGTTADFLASEMSDADKELARAEAVKNGIAELMEKYRGDDVLKSKLDMLGNRKDADDAIRLMRDLSIGSDKLEPGWLTRTWDRKMVEAFADPKFGPMKTALMKNYMRYLSTWKTLSVSTSPATITANAISGAFLNSMMGFNSFKPEYGEKLAKVAGGLLRKDPDLAFSLFGNNGLYEAMMEKYPETFREFTGMDPRLVQHGQAYLDQMLNAISKGSETNPAIKKNKEIILEAYRNIRRAQMSAYNTKTAKFSKGKVGSEIAGETAFQMQEIMGSTATKFIEELESMGKKGNPIAKAAHFMLTKPSDVYSIGDQSHRIATMLSLVEDGVTEGELRRIDKWMRFQKGDVTKMPSGRYSLTPERALEFASRAHLNYKAMPGFAKIAKNVPVLGSPFMSFSAGAAAQTARTLGLTPDYFNRLNFMIRELSGDSTPQEKEQADSEYNANLQEPGWMKLRFFRDNPTYLNMQQFIPHYSVNWFRHPDNRDLEAEYGKDVASIVTAMNFGQNAGLMGTPEGRFLVDYMLVPALTGEMISAQGSVTSPEDASLLERLGLGAAGLVSNLAPRGVMDAAALVPVTPPVESLPYFPRAYQAMKKPLMGITGGYSESMDPGGDVLKRLGAEAGFPTQEVITKK